MKNMGILGHSAEGASLCFLGAVHEAEKHLGEHNHPDLILDCMAMGPTLPWWEKNDFARIREYLMKSADNLARAGADFFILPDNTAHLALEAKGNPFPIPALHIAAVVAEAAKEKRFRKIGILGTKWTMLGPLYRKAFEQNGIEWDVPGDEDIALLNGFIFDHWCSGRFPKENTDETIRMIADLKGRGCDAVVLGCTEIPIVITPENSPLPTLDSTRLLAKAGVRVALGDKEMPQWLGGKVFT